MKEKPSYKNPYHQTQSELAEWLALFAQDYSTTEVADALVERYPERSTSDSKAEPVDWRKKPSVPSTRTTADTTQKNGLNNMG